MQIAVFDRDVNRVRLETQARWRTRVRVVLHRFESILYRPILESENAGHRMIGTCTSESSNASPAYGNDPGEADTKTRHVDVFCVL